MIDKLTCEYSGNAGTVRVLKGNHGWFASFAANDTTSPGKVFATFGNGHNTPIQALQAALNAGLVCRKGT